jgi:hypothetical protein
VKSTVREVLVDSHVSAFAVVVVLLWSLDAGFKALWIPLSGVAAVLIYCGCGSLTLLAFRLNSLSLSVRFGTAPHLERIPLETNKERPCLKGWSRVLKRSVVGELTLEPSLSAGY